MVGVGVNVIVGVGDGVAVAVTVGITSWCFSGPEHDFATPNISKPAAIKPVAAKICVLCLESQPAPALVFSPAKALSMTASFSK